MHTFLHTVPSGPRYPLQAPSFKFGQFIPSAASGGFPLLSLADAST
ncbi:MAG: hypothetical protein IM606_00425 [Cytophagales bacterium]|nr:hypothetical protein [Cytophagales bacterium]MCA6387383.1 hypothetical protein [Cytophagales bacterium]MCA6390168.1 hypothetical protein [Cytophagales bacterium]MCA6393626.1 hypothetical protein [Cytophagales bacterium]MCA6397870.1 hypothetical protein [Cytophagales bacterium]